MSIHQIQDPMKRVRLAELHSHLGGAADSATLWSLAHEQGIKLPRKDYWSFDKMVTINRQTVLKGVTALDKEKYHWTELIQSSPLAMEPTVHRTLGGAYRANRVVIHEIRYNPMKRNRGGERDVDYIIMATIRGMEKAMLEYEEIKAGMIIILDRTFSFKLNTILYEKALKYQHRGVVGIDIAGPQSSSFNMKQYVDLFADAKKKGLGVTIHTGEEGTLEEMKLVAETIEPHRIGHGFLAWKDKKLIGILAEKAIVLELCPTSNLNIGVVKNIAELRKIYRTLYDAGVKLTINTDGPEMHDTNLWREFNFLKDNNVFSDEELARIRQNAFEATFICPTPSSLSTTAASIRM